jgi:FAD/FMN-containing dehydrogenase
MNDVIAQLTDALGEKSVITGASVSDKYKTDWSGLTGLLPSAVVRASSTEDVSSILEICNSAKQSVVIQGGMTGISGGAVPQEGEIAISLEKMSGIIEVDVDSMTITAHAGTPLQVVQEAADQAGLYLPLDMGSRGTCTVGGVVATNAGGNQVIRYGATRSLVLGLEAVLPDGTIISSLNKMLKNNAGYDLKHMFIGSEGTLGIVTKAVMRLYPKMTSTQTALCALPDFTSVLKLLKKTFSTLGDGITSFEVMWANYYDEVVDTVEQAKSPFAEKHPFYALVEYKSQDRIHDMEQFSNVLFEAMEDGIISDTTLAQSLKQANVFWTIRDGIGELLTTMGPVVNTDISVPISQMKAFIEQLEPALYEAFPNVKLRIFGHIGDSNLHVCAGTGSADDLDAISALIMGVTGEYKGSVSAEHGIGVLKKKYLHHSRTPEEIALMKTLKSAMDPNGILNSGRVI